MKDVIISMSRAWDKGKKSESPTGFEPIYALPNTGWVLYPLSYGETGGEHGHLLGSYSRTRVKNMNLVYGAVLHESLHSSVDRAPTRCSGGHRIESCRGLKIFSLSHACDMLIITSFTLIYRTYNSPSFFISIILLENNIII